MVKLPVLQLLRQNNSGDQPVQKVHSICPCCREEIYFGATVPGKHHAILHNMWSEVDKENTLMQQQMTKMMFQLLEHLYLSLQIM